MVNYFKIMINARLAKMEERGASAVEYGLLIAGIAALIVIAVFALGPIIKEAFSDTCNAITTGNTTITATCKTELRHTWLHSSSPPASPSPGRHRTGRHRRLRGAR